MGSGDTLAGSALAVALAALVIALCQLLQQYAGTAEGHRRCQASSIGPWARKTKRKFHWSQFRFEVLVTTPIISIRRVRIHRERPNSFVLVGQHKTKAIVLAGTEQSRADTLCPRFPDEPRYEDEGDLHSDADLASWLPLLDLLHRQQSRICELDPYRYRPNPSEEKLKTGWQDMTLPAITFRQRSWDLMPPDILRPLAISTVGDIIIIANRLGMNWVDLRPSQGILHAEGNGQVLTGSGIRGFGIVLQYTRDSGHSHISHLFPFIPRMEADKLGFGIINVDSGIGLAGPVNIHLAPEGELNVALSNSPLLERSLGEKLASQRDSVAFPAIKELASVVMPFLPLHGGVADYLRDPLDVTQGIFRTSAARLAFVGRLEHELAQMRSEKRYSKHLESLLERFNTLCEHPVWMYREWLPPDRTFPDTPVFNIYSEDLEAEHLFTTGYFRDLVLQARKPTFGFSSLVIAHLHMAHAASQETHLTWGMSSQLDPNPAGGPVNAQRSAQMGDYPIPWDELDSQAAFEQFHLYVDNLPNVIDRLRQRHEYLERAEHRINRAGEPAPWDEACLIKTIELWWTLMFRALVWNASFTVRHDGVSNAERKCVPGKLWDSRVPVYIA